MLAYCPWSNGAVECLGHKLLSVLQTFISELQINAKEWLDPIRIVQLALNTFAFTHRDNACPIMAFFGRKPISPVLTFHLTSMATPVMVTGAQHKSMHNGDDPLKLCVDFHPRVRSILSKHIHI